MVHHQGRDLFFWQKLSSSVMLKQKVPWDEHFLGIKPVENPIKPT